MKSLKITICLFLGIGLSTTVLSQNVGINTTGTPAHASAGLDVNFTDKGVLIPRIALASNVDVTTIPAPATSLLVYNSNAAMVNGDGLGFYYWDGAQWISLGAQGPAGPQGPAGVAGPVGPVGPAGTGGGIDWTTTVFHQWNNTTQYNVPTGSTDLIIHFWGANNTTTRQLNLGTCSATTNTHRQIIAVNHLQRNATTNTTANTATIGLTNTPTARWPGLNAWGPSATGDYNLKTFYCMDVPTVGWRWTWR